MSLNNTVLRLSDHGKEPTKLKFGIDRLLEKSEDKTSSPLKQCFTTISSGIITSNGITKPTPTIAVPCSDCVSSLYRCCKASNICTQGDVAGYIGAHMFGSTTTTYSIQPIRPFATRPNLRITSDPHPQPSPPSSLSISQNSQNKRKRSWSRAVFSNLQRKGLERRFQLQKYITKPDRRQLAATLGLTDAQVKVWFQNRRMKWRHSRESSAQSNENAVDSTQDQEMQIDVDTVTEDVD